MKYKARPLFTCLATAVICATFSKVLNSHASTIDRLKLTDTLDLPAAWSTGVVPTGTDAARLASAVNEAGATAGIASNVTFG